MRNPLHFYHIGANGDWPVLEGILTEHFALLDRAGFTGDYIYGIVGPPENRALVREWLDERGEICAEADEGFEQVTLQKLYERCRGLLNPDVPVLYTHTKGAWNTSLFNDRWRQEMDELLISPWPLRVAQLTEVDALGLHWLTPANGPSVTHGFFGGNFWWANAGFLAKLPELDVSHRHGAEGWIGLGNPSVLDLKPGWPVY